MSDPYLSQGKWIVPKDPEDQRYYTADVTKDLTDSATTAVSVVTIVAGVVVLEAAVISGTKIIIKLGSLDVSTSPLNYCTFRVTCANTEVFDRTMWFVKEDH
jgi:hypothetical protein